MKNSPFLKFCGVIMVFIVTMASCNNDSFPDIPEKEDTTENTTDLQEDISIIKEAWENDKIVSDYYQVDNKDWFITFSDGSRIQIRNFEIITDISRDETEGTVTFFIIDGQVFTFYLKISFPHLVIKTPQAITSKDVWTEGCYLQITNSKDYNTVYDDVQIKGRGNSTWAEAKKPYAIKLDKKAEVLGLPKHKRWVLLANYFDKSNLRTEIAFFLSRLSEKQEIVGLTYTPRTKYITMMMNSQFQGLYQITEQLKIDENRVNVGDDGFLLEIDYRAYEDPDNISFRIPHIPEPLVIKDPDVIEGDENFTYIKEYMVKVDNILFSENFLDPDLGYKKYIDINSFIDWYIVNEVSKNNDASFYTSCYMNLERDGKLKMGPVWDFDLAFGNYPSWWSPNISNINSFSGHFLKSVTWYKRMMEDPEFIETFKNRFVFYYNHRDELYQEIDRQRYQIQQALKDNERTWHFYTNPYNETITLEMHQKEVEGIKDWIEARFQWLYKEYMML